MRTTCIILFFIAAATLTSSAKEGIPTDEAIAQSTPYPIKSGTVKLGKHELKFTPLTLPKPILSAPISNGITGMYIDQENIYIMIGFGKAVGYKTPPVDANTLAFQPAFGTDGELDVEKKFAKGISVSDQGVVFANGPWSSMQFKNGEPAGEIKGGQLRWRPGKSYGFMTATDSVIIYTGKEKPGPTIPATGASKMSRAGWVNGGIAFEMEEENNKNFVRVVDAKGNARFDIGNKQDVFASNGFCSIGGITSTDHLIVVSDTNCRKLVFFSNDGEHIGAIKARDLGLNYPWMPAIAFGPDGNLYLGAEEDRKTTGEDKVKETIILRIEGLDALK